MKLSALKNKKTAVVGETLFLMLSLPSCLSYVQWVAIDLVQSQAASGDVNMDALNEYASRATNIDLPGLLFLTVLWLAMTRFFRGFRLRGSSRVDFVKYMVFGGAFACAAVLLKALGDSEGIRLAIGSIFWATLFINRVHAIVRNHRLGSLLINLAAILLIGIGAFSMMVLDFSLLVEMSVAATQSLLSIMAIVFARVNVSALKKIIRQTYAVEIIIGLLLLIFSFAYVLTFMEPNTKTLADALWYCFAIVTTIGFGDITATSTVGRILSVVLGIYGIIVVALITSIIVNFYGEMKREGIPEGEDGD